MRPAAPAAVLPPAKPPSDRWFPQPVHLPHVRRLVLDPGHGGDNMGAVGVAGMREKVLCLDIARAVAAYVRAHSDVEVVLTRETDVAIALRDRPRLANEWRGDALVSLHANAHENTEAQGMEVFFLAADSSVDAARELIEREEGIHRTDPTAELPWSVGAIVSDMGLRAAHDRSEVFGAALATALQKVRTGVRFRGLRQAPFGVLKEAQMPALVLEVGYLTHAQEARTLRDPSVHQQFGQAMLLALVELDRQLALQKRPSPAAAPTAAPTAAIPAKAPDVASLAPSRPFSRRSGSLPRSSGGTPGPKAGQPDQMVRSRPAPAGTRP